MKRAVCIAIAAVFAGWGGSLAAAESPDHVEREVLGWVEGENELAVRMTGRGERFLEGGSKDYYFQLTEVWGARRAERLRRYQHDESSGVAHPLYREARSEREGETFLDEAGWQEAHEGWTSPENERALALYRTSTLDEVPHNRRGTQFACIVESELVLLSPPDERAFVLETWRTGGDPASRRKDASCPQISTDAYWHPQGSHWALIRRVVDDGVQRHPPQLYAGSVDSPSASRSAELVPSFRPLERYTDAFESPDLREGWRAMRRRKYEAAVEAFRQSTEFPARRSSSSEPTASSEASADSSPASSPDLGDASPSPPDAGSSDDSAPSSANRSAADAGSSATSPDTSPSSSPPAPAGAGPSESEIQRTERRALFGLAWSRARLEKTEAATETLERAGDIGETTAWSRARRAAVFEILEVEAAERRLDEARELADNHDDYRRMGELFRAVDVSIANDLLVESLQAEGAEPQSEVYRRAYTLLIKGLIDAKLFDEAQTLLDKVATPTPRMQLQHLRLTMERTETDTFDERNIVDRTAEVLFEHAGVCAGYLLHGRALAQVGRWAEARAMLQAARVCDPARLGIEYDLGAVEMRIGEREQAIEHLEMFLRDAPAREGDQLRGERRRRARRHLERLRHGGVRLSTVRCTSTQFGALECGGALTNASEERAETIEVRMLKQPGDKEEGEAQELASTTVGSLPPGETTTFVLEFSETALERLRIEAGRDDEERAINRMPAVFE